MVIEGRQSREGRKVITNRRGIPPFAGRRAPKVARGYPAGATLSSQCRGEKG